MCSRGLQRIQVRDMGKERAFTFFVDTGATLASFQIGGKVPESHYLWKRCFRISDSRVGWKVMVRMLGFIWSGPASLWRFGLDRSFSIPLDVTVMSSMDMSALILSCSFMWQSVSGMFKVESIAYIWIYQTPVGDIDICASSCRNISKAKNKEGGGV